MQVDILLQQAPFNPSYVLLGFDAHHMVISCWIVVTFRNLSCSPLDALHVSKTIIVTWAVFGADPTCLVFVERNMRTCLSRWFGSKLSLPSKSPRRKGQAKPRRTENKTINTLSTPSHRNWAKL